MSSGKLRLPAAAAHVNVRRLASNRGGQCGPTATLRRERPDALLIGANPINVALRREWLAFAAEERLPMLVDYRGFGALLSYGPDYFAIYRRAAEYVAKILGGANPGDLPMEWPTKLELVINLKMAKAIGLTIPQSLLVQADEIIR